MKTKAKPAAKQPAKKTPTPAPAGKTVSTVSNKPAKKDDRTSKLLKTGAAMEEAEKQPAPAPVVAAPEPAAAPPPAPVAAPPIAPVVVKPAAPPVEIVPDTAAPGKKRYVSKTAPDSKYHLRDRSTAESPVSIVKRLCAEMMGQPRKAVLDACIKLGVNKNTAATQYAVYHKKLKDDAEHARLLALAGEAGDEGGEE